ncbi:MAG: glycoside hydrolase family 3 C-terminal domain-containing protein [Lachnospiraceae bacterium]|nr:glycoside hydrolase family 3 C-terminal domain-containing protein [Lachnospiraceae bacterium]
MALEQYEKKHLRELRNFIAECTLFLKNDRTFPIKHPCEVALYGNGARRTIFGGTGSGEVNSRFKVSIEKGLEKAGFTVTTGDWLNSYDRIFKDARKKFVQMIKERSKAQGLSGPVAGMGSVMPEPDYDLPLNGTGDLAIYVLSRICGEGADRLLKKGDIFLTDTEVKTIHELNEKHSKFMLVLNVGGPVDLSPVSDIKNILLLSQLGAGAGVTFTDILLGKQNPSGKLATTWSCWSDYPHIGDFGDINDTRYDEGIYVGYRYFDTVGKKAMFPFGFGASYTKFEVTPKSISAKKDTLTVKAKVKNTGKFAGKEVVQLYVSKPGDKYDEPYQVLAGWIKTPLIEPDGQATVSVRFSLSDITTYDSKAEAYVLEKGNYILRIGNSSRNTSVAGVAALDKDVTVRKVKNSCGNADINEWIPEKRRYNRIPKDCPVIDIHAEDIKTEQVSYRLRESVLPEVKNLTNEELAMLSVGSAAEGVKNLSIVGNAAQDVAGAAGQTHTALSYKGFSSLIMADGPAGLRLSKNYYIDNSGAHPVGTAMPETMLDFLPTMVSRSMRNKGAVVSKIKGTLHQYCTAIPIGTAIAQSWNTRLAEACGDIVGSEMEIFGVHLWLAPALNIHRDIRCGRNFEYFSEDPLISGKFAAALTQGVQEHPNCAVTIKHFAANNQETNRYNSNSIVSERAMREIYLKGFEIVVKEASPKTVMTSYNLLNGTHTSEHVGLLRDILRCEFGFKGVIMTDWIIEGGTLDKRSLHRGPISSYIANAGSELVMPGSVREANDIIDALNTGELSRDRVEKNISRLLSLIRELIPISESKSEKREPVNIDFSKMTETKDEGSDEDVSE